LIYTNNEMLTSLQVG